MRVYLLVFTFFFSINIIAQPVIANFSIPSEVCLGEFIPIQNNSSPEVDVLWDFCANQIEGSYSSIPSSFVIGSMTDLEIVEDQGLWYGFAVSRNNVLLRLEFGDNPNNAYTITSLGNPNNLLNSPEGISLVKEGGNWIALVTLIGNEIIRLSWGSSLLGIPSAESLNVNSFNKLNSPIQISIAHDIDHYVAIIANASGNYVTSINFGSSLMNTISSNDVLASPVFPGASNMYGVTISNQCNQWFLYAITEDKIFKVELGSDLFSPILLPQIDDFTADIPLQIGAFNKIEAVDLGSNTYLYFTSITKNRLSLIKLEGGTTIPQLLDIDNPVVPGNTYAFDVFQYQGNYGLYVSGFGGSVNRISITENCDVNTRFSTIETPKNISYNSAGIFTISLTIKSADGSICSISKEITVLNNLAPLPIIELSETICTSSPISFSAESINEIALTNWDWNFDDTNTSTDPNPDNSYTQAGSYTVLLEVIGSNGCNNRIDVNLTVYNPPSASFTLPTGLICTNNEFTFVNNTVDNFDGNLSFQWLLDEVPVSTDEDLLYTFTSGGDKELTLQASIPGCTSESVQVLADVGVGPTVDFIVEGVCLNESTQLTNNSQGDIASYAWNFGDGQLSSDTSPAVNYAAAGNYIIELQTLGTNDCLSTKSLSHQIFSAPQPNFNTDLPPFSCSGTPTQFNDLTPPLTDSNLNAWSWDFGDQNPNASAQHPQHTYALSGDYNVSLTTTSDRGCAATLNKVITIAQSPQPIISNTAACIETAVILQDVSLTSASAWQWQVGNNFYFTESPSHVFSDAGDYEISLTVTASNGCVGTSTKQINVPLPLLVDFESAFNCANTPTQFTALINDSSDPILTHTWTFAEEEKNGINVNHLYNQTGIQEVKLTAMATSGCVYSITKVVDILPAPIANFSFTPLSGSPPLAVTFTNLSTDATSFEWQFNDANNTTSNLNNPSFTFTEAGEYAVDLTVANAAGCESTISKLIAVAFPFVNLTLDNFRIISNTDGSSLLLINIRNNGNVLVQNPRIEIQLDNTATLQEVVNTSIVAGDSFDYTLSTVVASNNLNYACVRLLLPNNEAQENTEVCLTFNSGTALTSPYPNPANDFVTVEWICAAEEQVLLAVSDNLGNVMATENISAKQGLNTIVLQTIDWQAGIYFIRLKSASKEHYFRTIIAR